MDAGLCALIGAAVGGLVALSGLVLGAELAWRASRRGESLLRPTEGSGPVRYAKPGELVDEEDER